MQTPFLAAFSCAVVLASSASAQSLTEGWEFDGRAQLVVAVSTVDEVERLPARNVLGEVGLRATAEKTLQNSAEIGFRFEAKAQQDNPARAGFTGNIDPFGSEPDSAQVRGAYSGLTRSGLLEDASLTGSIETAQFYIDGGYGQISVGYGRGVAARFHEGAPDIFTHVRAANPKLDPGGLNFVRTENDLTGPAPKLTYQTPRLLGVRAGVSFTPDANVAGVDRDPRRSTPGVVSPEIENVWEGSVQASRKLTEQNLRIRASVSYSQGEVSLSDSAPVDFESQIEDVSVWTIGSELEFETFSIGAEYLSSDNGIRDDGDYSAWSIGATTEAFDWDWGVRYGESEDENVQAENANWSIGAAKNISENARLAIGYHSSDADFAPIPLSNPQTDTVSGPDGLVVEITLSL